MEKKKPGRNRTNGRQRDSGNEMTPLKKNAGHWLWHIAGLIVFGTLAVALAMTGWPWLKSMIPESKPQSPPAEHWSPPAQVNLAPHLAALPWQRDVHQPVAVEIPAAHTPWKRDAAHPEMVSLPRATLPNWKQTP
jgi:hypothetical protein